MTRPAGDRVPLVWAPVPLLVAPLLSFLRYHAYPLFRPDVLFVLAAIVLPACLLALVASHAPRLLAGLVIAFSVSAFVDFSTDLSAAAHAAILSITLGWHLLGRESLRWFLHAAALALLAGALLLPVGSYTDEIVAFESDTDRPTDPTRPPILHIVLDGHDSISGLAAANQRGVEAAHAVQGLLMERGFTVFANAYSRYEKSYDSIPNLLNYAEESSPGVLVADTGEPYRLVANRYFEDLVALGYDIHVRQSDFMQFCDRDVVSSCRTYVSRSINVLQRAPMAQTQRAVAILAIYARSSSYYEYVLATYRRLSHSDRNPVFLRWLPRFATTGPLGAIELLDDLTRDVTQLGPGTAYFAHVLLPHLPSALQADCQIRDVREWDFHGHGASSAGEALDDLYERYADQVQCLGSKLSALLDAVADSAVVIVHGDHGSRISHDYSDLLHRFGTLLAIRIPDSSGKRDAYVAIQPFVQSLIKNEFRRVPEMSESPSYVLRRSDGGSLVPTDFPE